MVFRDTLAEILYGPRFVYDPEETGVDDWMLYLPSGYVIKDGSIRPHFVSSMSTFGRHSWK